MVTCHRFSSTHKDEFLKVQDRMAQVGPQDFARLLLLWRQPIRMRLLSQKVGHLPEFDLIRRAAQGFQEETLDPSRYRRLLSRQYPLRPGLGLVHDERFIHE